MHSKLFVVHHSKPLESTAFHPSQLPLSRSGVMLAVPLAEASFWDTVTTLYYSPEVAAAQTAELIGRRWPLQLHVEEKLSDMWIASGGLDRDSLAKIVGSHLEGSDSSPMLEDYDQAQQRIVHCVQRLAVRHAGENFAIMSHSRLITAFYSHLLGRRLGREEWLSLRTPDLSVIDLPDWVVSAGFFSDLAEQGQQK